MRVRRKHKKQADVRRIFADLAKSMQKPERKLLKRIMRKGFEPPPRIT